MATLVIRARFPLGVYLGHQPDGQPSPFPDTARLLSALLHAAGKGSSAVEVNGDLRPSRQSFDALTWLEEHPPSAVALPQSTPVAGTGLSAEAYRDEGVHDKAQKDFPTRRKVRKHQSDAVALNGYVGWAWDEGAPDDVVTTIGQLCEDVSCLGEADSPVILELADIEVTHLRDTSLSAFPAPGGVAVRTPVHGRVDELEADYTLARPAKQPTTASDRHSWTALPASHRVAASRTRPMTYRPITPPLPDLPWVGAIVRPLLAPIDARDRVQWCVAFHRACAAYLADDAAPLLTGKYLKTVRPPANRIAVHFLEGEVLRRTDSPHGAFLVMAPRDANPEELALVMRAINGVRTIYRRNLTAIPLGSAESISTEHFWDGPLAGTVRYWRPIPGMVPETRRQRGQAWTLQDAALLSIGHVFRDRLAPAQPGEDRYRSVIEQVKDWGVKVHDVHPIHDSRVERYAHKLPPGMVAQPYTARLDLSAVLPDQALLAVGQSRHLGGGLLVPADESIASARELYGWGL